MSLCRYAGHKLEVDVYRYGPRGRHAPEGGERLSIDEKVVDERHGGQFCGLRFPKTLLGRIDSADGSFLEVKARTGWRRGCRVWVGRELVMDMIAGAMCRYAG